MASMGRLERGVPAKARLRLEGSGHTIPGMYRKDGHACMWPMTLKPIEVMETTETIPLHFKRKSHTCIANSLTLLKYLSRCVGVLIEAP